MPSSTRKMAAERRKSAWRVTLIGIAGLLVILAVVLKLDFAGIGALVALALVGVARIWNAYTDRIVSHHLKREKHALRGAAGEEEVQRLLDSLDGNYLCIHDVECPYGNIDHVVVSRSGGVFLIETKAHGGKVDRAGDTLILNGHDLDKDFIAQVNKNTYWLRDQIGDLVGSKPWVTAFLVFTSAFVPWFPPIKGIKVMNKRFLLKNLTSTRSNTADVWQARDAIREMLSYKGELWIPPDYWKREAA